MGSCQARAQAFDLVSGPAYHLNSLQPEMARRSVDVYRRGGRRGSIRGCDRSGRADQQAAHARRDDNFARRLRSILQQQAATSQLV